MFKRLRTLLITICGTVAICCGAGLSYWFFATTSQRNIESGAELEDIWENYNSGKPNPIPQYDMYIFPSTWYLAKYGSSADEPLPEKKYGYIERTFNEHSEIVDTYVDPSGNKSELVPMSYVDQYCYDIDNYDNVDYMTDFKTFKLPKNADSEPQFKKPESNTDLPRLFPYRHGNWPWDPFRNDYVVPSGSKGFNDYGSPAIDKEDTAGVKLDGTYQETEDPKSGGQEGKPIYQKLNLDDRLGYWYERDVQHGRFLPIKISFSGSLSPQTFLKMVPNPRADMADANAWHNYSFCNWVYYRPGLDEKPYKEPADGFTNYDMSNIFDVLLNLENVAIDNKITGKKEIRLFPLFNNGKDYRDSDIKANDEFDPNAVGQGFRDSLKIEYIASNDDGSQKVMQSRYFIFQKGEQDINYDGVEYNYAVLNNFNTDEKKLDYINFSSTYTSYSYSRTGTMSTPIYGDWTNFDAGSNINSLEAGDKNIYAICVNGKFNGEKPAKDAILKLVNAMKNNTSSGGVEINSYKGLFGDLKNRELSAIYNNVTDKDNILTVQSKTGGYYRAYALFFERILDLKTVTSFPLKDEPTGVVEEGKLPVYEEKNRGDLIKHYEDVYDISRNLFNEDNYFYFGKKDPNKNETFIPDSPSSLNETHKFIYKISTLDLSKPESKFFNFRIEKYNSVLSDNIKFNLNPLQEGQLLFESNTPIDQTGTIKRDESNTFVNAGEYFEAITFSGIDKDNPDGTFNTQGFKLKEKKDQNGNIESDGTGFYSIVIIFNPTQSLTFDVYAYKHKNLFVKIFDKEPEGYPEGGDKHGFLNHTPTDVKYFERTYDYAEIIDGDDMFIPVNGQDEEKVLIDDVVREFCNNRHSSNDTTGLYKDYTGPVKGEEKEDTEEVYYCVDHVTKTILVKAIYDPNDKDAVGNFVIKINSEIKIDVVKNYVLYFITDAEYRSNKYNPLNWDKGEGQETNPTI